MKKILKKILAPVIRELLKEDEEIKKIVHQQSYEALAKATREASKFSL
jgi:hypothetical protein